MKSTIISSTKFDGSLHYRIPGQIVYSAETEIRVFTPSGTAIQSYRGDMVCRSHSLRIFWTDRHWNLMVRWFADFRPEDHYVNIATPAIVNPHTINWIDLDLDLITRHGDHGVIVDDIDEFEAHQKKWAYPSPLIEKCWIELKNVQQMMQQQAWPFDGSLYSFRP